MTKRAAEYPIALAQMACDISLVRALSSKDSSALAQQIFDAALREAAAIFAECSAEIRNAFTHDELVVPISRIACAIALGHKYGPEKATLFAGRLIRSAITDSMAFDNAADAL
ncbi:MAG: hypothetical protein ABSA13_16450 [Beijerinckiaceae bacterium]|jgi:hypothetical protein